MNTNQITSSKFPTDLQKAITSLISGITSILLVIACFKWLIILLGAPLVALLGLIAGVKGLGTIKKNFAIAGIVLSLIGLLASIYLLLTGGIYYILYYYI